MFTFDNGITILAVDGLGPKVVDGRQAGLINPDGTMVQRIQLIGEVSVRGKTQHADQRAYRTADAVALSLAEAESGDWQLQIDPETIEHPS